MIKYFQSFKRFFGRDDKDDQAPLPKFEFPTTLKEFNYHFNENGELRDGNGDGFKFAVSEDHNYNQQRYDALGEAVTDYIYDVMQNDLGLIKVPVPLGSTENDPRSFVFISPELVSQEKLMLLIHGAGPVRAGQWTRKLIINENLDTGSQLPYIRRAMKAGYGVIVCNPNLNQAFVHSKLRDVKENKTPEDHGVYVWRNFVQKAKARNVVIVAHSYGGIVTHYLAEEFLEDFKTRVFCVVFTDSVHAFKRNLWSSSVKQFMKHRAINFAASYVPINTLLDLSDPDDCQSVSAGTEQHERTSHSCIDLAFKFIQDNYISWCRDFSPAPRHFLPLPKDLTQYQPANKWHQKKDDSTSKKKSEGETDGKPETMESSELKDGISDEIKDGERCEGEENVKGTYIERKTGSEEEENVKETYIERKSGNEEGENVKETYIERKTGSEEGEENVKETYIERKTGSEEGEENVKETYIERKTGSEEARNGGHLKNETMQNLTQNGHFKNEVESNNDKEKAAKSKMVESSNINEKAVTDDSVQQVISEVPSEGNDFKHEDSSSGKETVIGDVPLKENELKHEDSNSGKETVIGDVPLKENELQHQDSNSGKETVIGDVPSERNELKHQDSNSQKETVNAQDSELRNEGGNGGQHKDSIPEKQEEISVPGFEPFKSPAAERSLEGAEKSVPKTHKQDTLLAPEENSGTSVSECVGESNQDNEHQLNSANADKSKPEEKGSFAVDFAGFADNTELEIKNLKKEQDSTLQAILQDSTVQAVPQTTQDTPQDSTQQATRDSTLQATPKDSIVQATSQDSTLEATSQDSTLHANTPNDNTQTNMHQDGQQDNLQHDSIQTDSQDDSKQHVSTTHTMQASTQEDSNKRKINNIELKSEL